MVLNMMKRTISKLLIVTLLTTIIPINTVFAETKYQNSTGSVLEDITTDEKVGQDYSQSSESEYAQISDDSTEETSVKATVKSTFRVSIPKTIILDGKQKQGEYSVSVDGDIVGNEMIVIKPDSPILLSQTKKTSVFGAVVQDKIAWTYDELGTDTSGKIVANGLSAGSWTGNINFSIDVGTIETVDDSATMTDWEYTLDDTNQIITLNKYIGESSDVRVKSSYLLGNKHYYTHPGVSTDKDGVFRDNTSITSITFDDGVVMPEDCSYMFFGCRELTALDMTKVDMTHITNMIGMFAVCTKLTTLDISNFDTSNVTNMFGVFYGCQALSSIDVSHFNTTKVKTMQNMFASCAALTELNVTSFDTSSVEDMTNMFSYCQKIQTLDLSNFDTRKVV